ncbi:MAG: flagellar hook-length control protein FliK [Pseudomonadota bacterium]
MISVLMSEGLAPSNGAKSQEPPRDTSRSSKDEKFSSFMGSRDDPSEVDPKQENEVAAAAGSAATSEQTAPTGDTSSSSDVGRAASDTASVSALNLPPEDAATADTFAVSSESAEGESSTTQKADATAVDTSIRAADAAATAESSNRESDAETTVRASNPDTDVAPRASDADPRLASTSDTGVDPKIDDSGVRTASDAPGDEALKFTDTPGQSSGDGQSRQPSATGDLLSAADPDAAQGTDKIAADAPSTGELADLKASKQTVPTMGDETLVQVNVAREAAPLATESLLAVAPSATPSTAGPVATGGLAPTVPTHVIAAPNELTSVVMNALKSGGDVQEQLVVQLDPPELGRVLIDFKFDAQGLQQITVTSENPEALKRLRELHFELTQALKDQGFSDSNLSFQQEARDQSQSNWQAPEWARAQSQVVAAAERSSSASAMPTPPNFTGRDRLDLLL